MELDLKGYAPRPRIKAIAKAYKRYNKHACRPQAADQRKSALVIIGTGVGNIVEQTALVRAVNTMYEDVDVFLPLSTDAAAEVIKGMPGVRRLFVYRPGYAKLRSRKQPYSAIFATYLVCDFVNNIAHDAVYLGDILSVRGLSEKQLCLNAAVKAGYRGDDPGVWCRREAWDYQLLAAPLIGITAGGKPNEPWQLKRYPHYMEVIDAILAEQPDANFVNIGSLVDDALPHSRVVDLRGLTTIGQAATIAARCSVYIANDCGMSHVAAAVGTPTVVVFGPTRVLKNLPTENAVAVRRTNLRCMPCQYRKVRMGRRPWNGHRCKHECMRNLRPSIISNQVLQLVAKE